MSERASPKNPHYTKAIRSLVERREELGYSQYDVARLWEKPQSVIAKIERQQRTLSLFEFIEYCHLLKMDPVPVISHIHKQMSKKGRKRKPVSKNDLNTPE
ncbi:helix-turn-helix transcriptional regulator [Asticcacaulis sp.]|uniref:helix-turn-helix domain-containing protein n=1 Tax=Asticcacaulis sp. TaxID=1872648 RepID=UPI00345976D0